ncbi:NAD-dependent epimerase/dehydratase family protein [Glycomyces sp. NPDC048151]|uniref:NAD-dependent epimerase/dehydratase family protein n=1 Tax=Glycomyces sp. NPDC048151 TaxID=3364002 RepID=UPI0037146B1D
MSQHLIVGSGPVGSLTALKLAEAGDTVRIVSPSGKGPEHPAVERIALDANDTDALTAAAEGAATVFGTAMTPYHLWPETMPQLYSSILTAAECSGADYVLLNNLYGYSDTSGPISESTAFEPTTRKGRVRAAMWHEAKAAHDAGRVRATELRAGQFLGAGAVAAFAWLTAPKVVAGELALVDGDPDAPHSLSYIGDVADALIALARNERSYGRAWNAPVITTTVREAAARLAELHGAPAPRLSQVTERDFALLAVLAPMFGEFPEMAYMVDEPFTVDDSAIRDTFGLKASSLDEALAS